MKARCREGTKKATLFPERNMNRAVITIREHTVITLFRLFFSRDCWTISFSNFTHFDLGGGVFMVRKAVAIFIVIIFACIGYAFADDGALPAPDEQGSISDLSDMEALSDLTSEPVPNTTGAIQLPKTGQVYCYDTSNKIISCTDTGQDGNIQAGLK
jgi:hypothetical protein